ISGLHLLEDRPISAAQTARDVIPNSVPVGGTRPCPSPHERAVLLAKVGDPKCGRLLPNHVPITVVHALSEAAGPPLHPPLKMRPDRRKVADSLYGANGASCRVGADLCRHARSGDIVAPRTASSAVLLKTR